MKRSNNCKFKRVIYTVLSILIVALIFAQSLKSGDASSNDSGHLVAILNNLASLFGFGEPFTDSIVRTCAHFTEFFVLSVSLMLMYRAYYCKLLRNSTLSVVTASVVAVCDETLQLFSEGRAFEITDIFIDICGAVSSVIIIALLILLSERKKRTNSNCSEG